jgi:hypothetical protein
MNPHIYSTLKKNDIFFYITPIELNLKAFLIILILTLFKIKNNNNYKQYNKTKSNSSYRKNFIFFLNQNIFF